MTRPGRPRHPDILTPREWEVLYLLREDLSNGEIAERLGISRDGAKYHVSQILSKLNVESRDEAAAWRPSDTPAKRWPWLAAPLALKAAGATVVATAVVGTAVLGATVIMSDDAESFVVEPPDGGFPFPTFAPAVDWVPAGDVTPLFRQTDQPRLTDGEYRPELSHARDIEYLSELGFVPFEHDQANGIKVVTDSAEMSRLRNVCSGNDYWKFEEYSELEYEWFPPGTYEAGPQQAAVCPDGSVASFGQAFILLPYGESLQASYRIGDRVIWHEGQARYRGEIGTRPAVVLTYFQPSRVRDTLRYWIGMAVEYGVIYVDAIGMPLEDVLRAAEGVTCDYCGPP